MAAFQPASVVRTRAAVQLCWAPQVGNNRGEISAEGREVGAEESTPKWAAGFETHGAENFDPDSRTKQGE